MKRDGGFFMKKALLSMAFLSLTFVSFAQQNVYFQTACHPQDVKHYDTKTLRERFVMEKVMAADEINLTYSQYDRFIFGGAMPVSRDLKLETFDALKRNAERIKIISGERISDELNKIMLTKTPSKGFVELHRCGLLALILPELANLDVVNTRNGRAHKNNFYHTLEVLDNVSRHSDNLWLRWAALLHDVGKPKSMRWDNLIGWTFHNHNYLGAKMVPQMFRRLKLPLDLKMKYVQKLVDLHMRPIVIADEEVTDSAVRRLLNDAGDDIDDLMILCEADITSKNAERKQRFLNNFRIVREKIEDLKKRDYKRLFQPCIDGNEIMELFGLKPCREVGTLKQTIKDAVLDGKVENDRESLMALLLKKADAMGLKVK
jgi:putative nucleotidyltransferase with HDIG domain